MDHIEMDFYQQLRARMKSWMESEEGKTNKWAEVLMSGPDLFHLLCKLALDKEVLVNDKAKLAGALVYFIAPLDLVAEAFLGPVGYMDDIAIAAFVINSIIHNTDPDIVRKHWAGEGDVLDLVKRILNSADNMIGSGLWAKIRKMFS